MITTQVIGLSGTTERVFLDGQFVGDVVTGGSFVLASMGSRRGEYKFASRQDAINAVVSFATVGYWTKEI